MKAEEKQRVHIRWAIRRDMPEILAIEGEAFPYPWTEEQFINCLRQRNCIAMVAEHGDRVVGYMVYELLKARLQLLNFAVDADYRRQGVGRMMCDKLYNKLSSHRRTHITCEIREGNLDAQMFFRAMGYRAVSVLRDFYDDTDEDAYLMRRRYEPIESLSAPSTGAQQK